MADVALLGIGIGIRRSDLLAPTITSNASVSVDENATLSHTLTANETVTWSLPGGADAAQFELSGSTLRWSSNGTRDYETPADANADNAYVVTVRATDAAGNTTDQTVTVTVADVSEGPTYGPELWPQPDFNASTGLTLAQSSIAAGEWSTNGSGDPATCTVSSPPTFVEGEQYAYSFTVTANPQGEGVFLSIGGQPGLSSTVGTFNGTVTIGAGPLQSLFFRNNNNEGAAQITACSVKKVLS